MDFYEAWHYLEEHVIFQDEYGESRFRECLDIEVVKVNPETKEIDEDEFKNTASRIWLECGPYNKNDEMLGFCYTHDIELDCGGKNFEKAIRKLAKRVKKVYGNDKEKALMKVKKRFKSDELELDEKQLRR